MPTEVGSFTPAESVYAAIEVKQDLNKKTIQYAGKKIASVRKLHRTSAPISHAGGTYSAKTPIYILGGILTLGNTWKPPFGSIFHAAIAELLPEENIDFGCALQYGGFKVQYPNNSTPIIESSEGEDALIFFFLNLLYNLQKVGTVGALDISEYEKQLKNK